MPLWNFFLAIAVGWLAASFTVRTLVSSVALTFYLTGLIFSRADRMMNATGAVFSLLWTALFGVQFFGVCLFATRYVTFDGGTEAAAVFVFISLGVYRFVVLSKEIALVRMRAWRPGFAERVMAIPKSLRFSFAQEYAHEGPRD
jgi:hypothetical protein